MSNQLPIFESKYTVDGSLTVNEDIIDEIRAEITYNDIGNTQPSIIIRGADQKRKDVLNLFLKGKPSFEGEWTRKGYTYKMRFACHGSPFNLSFGSEGGNDVICKYNCEELIIDDIWKQPEAYKPFNIVLSIDYSLPTIRELSVPVDLIEHARKEGIHIDKMEYDTPVGVLSVRQVKQVASTSVGRRSGSFEYIDTTLHFESSDENIDRTKFLEDADSIVQDYLDVISMTTLHRVQFYKLELQHYSSDPISSFRTHKFYYRDDAPLMERIQSMEWQETNQLLKEIVPKYSHHADKQAIHHTLNLFLTAVQSRVVETRLIWLQNAIEVVVDNLEGTVETCSECGGAKKFLKNRLSTLANSEPPCFIDIYPALFERGQMKKNSEMTFPFIKIRNGLTHGNIMSSDHQFLVEELDRQQLLFERLLCKWIGVDFNNISYLSNKTFFKPWQGGYGNYTFSKN